MKLLVINNDGAGYADYRDVEPGTTVPQLFAQIVPGGKAENYLIRVNRQPVARDQVLQEGDRVSFTPVKIQGHMKRRDPPPRRPNSPPPPAHPSLFDFLNSFALCAPAPAAGTQPCLPRVSGSGPWHAQGQRHRRVDPAA